MLRRSCGVLAAVLVSGCYDLQRVQGPTPEVGTQIAFDVTDVGRVALGGSMGPEIAQIEGRLIEKGSADYLVAVSAVHLLRGGDQVWSGEPVRIKSEYVGSVYEKKFSRGKSIALGVVGVGLAAIIASQSIHGAGLADAPKSPPDTSSATRRRP